MSQEGASREPEENNDWELTQQRRRLQELFRGRFSERESQDILRHHGNDIDRTVSFLMQAKKPDLENILGPRKTDGVVQIRKDQVLRDLAIRNEVRSEVRQYACAPCDNVWWRRVPVRKPVSRCRKCKQKFDPISRDEEYGWSRFVCDCGHEFHGFGDLGGGTTSECYKCRKDCEPDIVYPPKPRRMRQEGLSHSCTGPNCFNRTPRVGLLRTRGHHASKVTMDEDDGCIHPKSTNKRVKTASRPHVSTGSTVLTFLDQDDVPGEEYEPSLLGIPEED